MGKKDMLKFQRGARLFQKVERGLLPRHKGQVVAIEPDSGSYFIGNDVLEAAKTAKAALPRKIFDFFRIGYPAVHKFRPARFRA